MRVARPRQCAEARGRTDDGERLDGVSLDASRSAREPNGGRWAVSSQVN
ncbi:hypothetical protein [Natrinema longum]|uniref:Uncharacterized protein n=1 Tax=Natrinema longum TaxID=370324 RepID=A0A8A2UDK8_9EURY|nr:hypothetical protein [Natrinema longum]MBZ6496094.1 hypothetical protein [Natrinema longum]QSW85978.1 hypothetical protein J0X27_03850 [Natrinema longum]